jgi:hypothetical protein
MAYLTHAHRESPHQGNGNIVPISASSPQQEASMRDWEPLGGLLQS